VCARQPWPGDIAIHAAADGGNFLFRQTVELQGSVGELLNAAAPGALGLFDRRNVLDVRMFTGSLSSLEVGAVLNGGNAAVIRAENGGWEVLQFQTAELIAANTFRLSQLLRGQAGSEVEMLAGAGVGAPFVLLDSAVKPLVYQSGETGLPITWRAGSARKAVGSSDFVEGVFAPGVRGYLPLSPVHLRAIVSQGGDIALTWIRRDRVNADAWPTNDIGMSEAQELYHITVVNGETVIRDWHSSAPQTVYAAADWQADLQAHGPGLGVSVAQISATAGAGRCAVIDLPASP
jgi:hypothetical protein